MTDVTPKFLPDRYVFLKSQLEADLVNLDDELSRIPVLVQEASERAAQAAEIRDSLKDSFILVSAQVGDKLRRDLGPEGKTKPRSETQIESEKILSPDYQKAREEYAEARLDAGLWESVVEGMRTKSQHLRTSADLLQAGFLTTDYILQKRREEIRKAVPAKVPIRS